MAILKKMYDWLYPKPVEPPATTAATQALADQAVSNAITDLRDAVGRKEEVRSLVSKIEDQIARNHFGELVEASMRGRG